jgi:hypothetical protein
MGISSKSAPGSAGGFEQSQPVEWGGVGRGVLAPGGGGLGVEEGQVLSLQHVEEVDDSAE